MSLSAKATPAVETADSVAGKQEGFNKQAAIESQAGSQYDETDPFGWKKSFSQTGTGPGGVPIYSVSQTASPEMQTIINALQRNKTAFGTGTEKLLAGADYGGRDPSSVIGDASSGIIRDRLGKQVEYLRPQQEAEVAHLDNRLRNQGLQPGTPGYDTAMESLKRSHGNTITGFLASAEPQAFSEAKSLYEEPLSLAERMFGQSGPTGPSWTGGPGLTEQPANYTGASANVNQAMMEKYKADAAQQQSMMSGLFGIPTAVLGGWARSGFPGAGAAAGAAGSGISSLMSALPMLAMSDVREKENLRRVGTLASGLGVYSFNFTGKTEPHVGVVAQEVEEVIPMAVHTIRGRKYVDYSMVR